MVSLSPYNCWVWLKISYVRIITISAAFNKNKYRGEERALLLRMHMKITLFRVNQLKQIPETFSFQNYKLAQSIPLHEVGIYYHILIMFRE